MASRCSISTWCARSSCIVQERAPARSKTVEFVIASNLALLNDEVLAFCRDNDVLLSTSLDGPADLHNRNRPRPGGNSHELAVAGIQRAQAVLGRSRVGALMTTTEASLGRVEEIVDEYLRLDLDGIFLRSLSPYGFAIKTKQFERYGGREWLAFYERGLRYIIEVNRRGRHFPEFYATLLLKRMLSDRPIGYVDLRSPAGIGLGALVYNYDGKVFASDEGRMLAEMGDRTFELGDLRIDDYRSLVFSDKLVGLIGDTLGAMRAAMQLVRIMSPTAAPSLSTITRPKGTRSGSSLCPNFAPGKRACCSCCSKFSTAAGKRRPCCAGGQAR